MYSSNAQPTGTNRPRACPNHVQNHTRDNTRDTYVHPRNQRTHTLFASTKQFPTNKPNPPVVGMFDEVERVTAAIAKRETPGPIPNPEVKPFSADGTATERLWESRTPPDKHLAGATSDLVAPAPFLARYE